MRISLLCLALIILQFATSQITITQTQMPKSGDTLRYSIANTASVNTQIAIKGANKTWDLSTITANSQDLLQYKSALQTPYFFYFLNQIGLKTADSFGASILTFKNIYSFYTKSSTVFKAEGIGYSYQGIPLASNYTDDDEIYNFPLDYNDSDVNTFRFKFSIPGSTAFSLVQKGTRTNIADGWGSIKTPFKTYSSVLRIKTIIDEVDSVQSQFGTFPFPRKQVIYKWLSADERMPVMEIQGTMNGTTFTPTRIQYRDKFLGLSNPLGPKANFTVDKTSGIANKDTFTFTDKSTPFATGFTWQCVPNTVSFVGGTTKNSKNPKMMFSAAGKYSVTLIASNNFGTGDTTVADLITIGANSVKINSVEKILVYPNPASNVVNIEWENAKMYAIRTVDGKLVDAGFCIKPKTTISINHLSAGTYFIQVVGEKETFYHKLKKD